MGDTRSKRVYGKEANKRDERKEQNVCESEREAQRIADELKIKHIVLAFLTHIKL